MGANIALGLGHELFGRANELAIMAAHKSIGLTILALSLLRLAWGLSHRPPPLPAAMPGWQELAARPSHLFFYVAMFALALTGRSAGRRVGDEWLSRCRLREAA